LLKFLHELKAIIVLLDRWYSLKMEINEGYSNLEPEDLDTQTQLWGTEADPGFLKLVVRAPGTYASQLQTSTYYTSVVHRAYTPNDLLLLFIKDLLVMGNQYFWWASKIGDAQGQPHHFWISETL
jgi:hypothetical protein